MPFVNAIIVIQWISSLIMKSTTVYYSLIWDTIMEYEKGFACVFNY